MLLVHPLPDDLDVGVVLGANDVHEGFYHRFDRTPIIIEVVHSQLVEDNHGRLH